MYGAVVKSHTDQVAEHCGSSSSYMLLFENKVMDNIVSNCTFFLYF